MEHTVWGYLKRASTEKLKGFLRQHAAGELTEDFSYIIPYVQAELHRRHGRKPGQKPARGE